MTHHLKYEVPRNLMRVLRAEDTNTPVKVDCPGWLAWAEGSDKPGSSVSALGLFLSVT